MDFLSQLHIGSYHYDLPDERIARYPLARRDQSKLLVFDGRVMQSRLFCDLPQLLSNRDLLVFNNTKVVRARLVFHKSTGARIEIFCLEPVDPADYAMAFQQTGQSVWKCIVGNLKKWKGGVLSAQSNGLELHARILSSENQSHQIEFEWTPGVRFGEILESFGDIPIPPYLHRESEPLDIERYQTVYSKFEGSVAAPTAGLHFTPELFSVLREKQVMLDEVTLHVGAGTFKPVQEEAIVHHEMHEERFSVSLATLRRIYANPGSVVAVGTTSVRTLESLYYIGLQVIEDASRLKGPLRVQQWEPYQNHALVSVSEVMRQLIETMETHRMDRLVASTQIMIVPGYRFRLVRKLITNFHQPQSTLLLLIGAFIGNDWQRVYRYALDNNFRFLSYGDSCFFLPQDSVLQD